MGSTSDRMICCVQDMHPASILQLGWYWIEMNEYEKVIVKIDLDRINEKKNKILV